MVTLDPTLLVNVPALEGLTAAERDELLKLARAARHEKGTTVFAEGATAHAFFLLLDGNIRVTRSRSDGQQIVIRHIAEGELFGIAAALGRTTYPATAVAAIDCVVLSWPSHLWPRLAARMPAFAAGTSRTIGARLEDTQRRYVELSTERVEQRVAHALLRLVEQSGRPTEDGIEIDFPLTREEIAEMTGTTLHTVSRLMSAWAERGTVAGGRQRVTVKDGKALRRIAEGEKS